MNGTFDRIETRAVSMVHYVCGVKSNLDCIEAIAVPIYIYLKWFYIFKWGIYLH